MTFSSTSDAALAAEAEAAHVSAAAAIIRAGGLVVFPTETVYGLGANALDARAVAGIFAAKGRPQDNPLIVHIASIAEVDRVARDLGPLARCLFDAFSPGPLTVILPRNPDLALAVTAGLDTVGVRIPASPIARAFLEACGVPVAAPSANQSGRPSPTSFAMARAEMEGRVDTILQGPDSEHGLESTIVWPEGEHTVHILRPGSISPDMVRGALDRAGFVDVKIQWKVQGQERGGGSTAMYVDDATDSDPASLPAAPGTRYRHYSPRARVFLFRNGAELSAILDQSAADTSAVPLDISRAALLGLDAVHDQPGFIPDIRRIGSGFRLLKLSADMTGYAHALYQSLVEADDSGCDCILAWLPSAQGLGLAVADRLRRAAGLLG